MHHNNVIPRDILNIFSSLTLADYTCIRKTRSATALQIAANQHRQTRPLQVTTGARLLSTRCTKCTLHVLYSPCFSMLHTLLQQHIIACHRLMMVYNRLFAQSYHSSLTPSISTSYLGCSIWVHDVFFRCSVPCCHCFKIHRRCISPILFQLRVS